MIFKEKENTRKAILVGFNHNSNKNEIPIHDSMDELKELTHADGLEVVDMIIQNKSKIDVRFYIGKGKVEEVRNTCEFFGANLVIFNDELSGAQMRNLTEVLEVDVVDRTAIILDIFAKRAKSKEGKLQVELAQLKYRLPRLRGFGKELSKIGGGGGASNRGAGEQKLELDRRKIDDRIVEIRRELNEVKKNRSVQRVQRKKSELPTVAVVGYTNAGKSTLMNYFVSNNAEDPEKKVFEKDMLFATLETSNRKIMFKGNKSLILTDTVGFVSKLPHNLVEAFKATLEEVTEADLLVHLVDASNEKYNMQISVTEKVLKEIGVEDTPSIIAFNKIDKLTENKIKELYPEALMISAKNGFGMQELIDSIKSHIFNDFYKVELLIPYSDGNIVSYLNENANIISEDYNENGTKLIVEISKRDKEKLNKYIINE